eukprot:6128868-Ditylum_brightwellii.AAC.1
MSDQHQINQSTIPPTDELDDLYPAQEQRTNDIFITLGVADGKGTLYTDLTRKFPVTAASSNKYVLIGYDYSSNAILTRLVRARNVQEMLEAYHDMYMYLSDCGFSLKLNIVDNEASQAINAPSPKKEPSTSW